MIGAMIINDVVANLIVLGEGQVGEMSAALGCEIVDARPYGLAIGDLRTDRGWTRNAGGEQMILQLLDRQQYDSYTVASKRAAEAEANAEANAQAAIDEAMAILTGEVEE